MATATKTLTEKEVIADLKAAMKQLKGNPDKQQTLLGRVAELCKEFSADPSPTTTKEQAQPADEKPIWLAPKDEIEEWLRKRWGVKTVKILSGLDKDVPTISSPKELSPDLVNVHKEGDDAYVLVEEKRRRALEDARTHLGLREALLCHAKWQDIHKEWHAYWVYFAETLVEVDGGQRVVCLNPNAGGCGLHCYWLGSKSSGNSRFARLGESA